MGPSREDVRTLNIIIVGDGKVGYTLAEHLSREEHNVTIVDTSEEALRKADESLDVMCIKGNGASITALREAGADTADLLIAATSMDEINMVCCLTAKRLGTVSPSRGSATSNIRWTPAPSSTIWASTP